jgi:hypothetical protein
LFDRPKPTVGCSASGRRRRRRRRSWINGNKKSTNKEKYGAFGLLRRYIVYIGSCLPTLGGGGEQHNGKSSKPNQTIQTEISPCKDISF